MVSDSHISSAFYDQSYIQAKCGSRDFIGLAIMVNARVILVAFFIFTSV